MYSLKKMTQKISKTYTLSFPKAAHSLEAQDQGEGSVSQNIFFFLPTPLAGSQRKIICGANEISWPPARGVGMIFSAPVSIFNVLPQGGSFVGSPLAAITHFWGILD